MIKADFIRSLGLGQIVNFEGAINGAEIDSRKLQSGAAFFALKGESSDGHNYVQDALQKGAALCVVAEDWAAKNPISAPLWIVPDPEKALQKLAEKWRLSFSIPVLAITGTNGKTTTRAMCAAIIKTAYILHTTSGNFNNQLGLPLTLLNLRPEHQFSLLEMGTNHFGEITRLCEIAHPNAGLITNVGWGHIEFFGNIEGVARAKSELFAALPENGIAFVNADDPLIIKMPVAGRKIKYGFENKDVDFRGKILDYNDEGQATLNINSRFDIHLSIPGKIAALNALAAVAVGLSYNVDEKAIIEVLESFQPINQRFVQIKVGPYQVINDVYNANPDSTVAALETFGRIKTSGRRIFVMGDMLELGQYSSQGHRRVGQAVAQAGIDQFYGVGTLIAYATEAAAQAGLKTVYHFQTKTDLLAALKSDLKEGDTLLVKGSRGSCMEEIIEGLKQ
ncbi:MAG TPA: UDP-N-acetylmuramoyl-tripeptide--D-alanyl-D-alanine ligase [Candidatus Marinimicrobia bacterium]|mgnify:CR=1 FL=1|nr:UDP-N-acetylmuramoyl-tripeptide--D-alanyl-D-alanine ligase [Candidatus Neomarinimicrobiota bacterium]HRS51695.1 UDP-N-acetylmuramoyl-tripeptide--D-alanyl-D-alanine ligase [Candidatus Neomarinimicrobiota bacterium]HRU92155.1 UDP-N-acetylmuramoyl-tripeptide--D-alanyl-D-alanine ligase [Candidatus Neomarinimicrobiota bacterium]